MELLVIRHGTAEPHGHPRGDAARALVEKGWEQSRSAGRFMQRIGRLPELVLTSPRVRARETAEGFCEAAGIDAPIEAPWLSCGCDPETAVEELRSYPEFDRVAVVGHEPDLSELLAYLIGAGSGRVRMKKGAVACVRLSFGMRSGELQFLLPPKAMRV
jgi:phosphohistidine phosphatase